MATTNQLVDRGKVVLSRVNDAALGAKLIIELAAAQERLEQEAFLPEFLYQRSSIPAVAADQIDFATALPRFIRLHNNGGGVWIANSALPAEERFELLKRYDEFAQLVQLYPGNLAAGAICRGYFMVDTLAAFRPKPSASFPVELLVHYYQSEAVIPAAGNTNLWTQKAGDYLLGNAGKILAQSLRDQAAMQVFQGLESSGKARLMKKSLGDEQANQDYVMGDD